MNNEIIKALCTLFCVAVLFFNTLLANTPPTVDEIIDQAKELRNQHKYSEAFQLLDSAMVIAESISYDKGIGNALVQYGRLYKKTEEYDKASDYYLRALQIRTKLEDSCGVASVYNNLSSVALNKNLEQALMYSRNAVSLGRAAQCWYLPNFLVALANVYEDLELLDSAIVINKESIQLAKEEEDVNGQMLGGYGLAQRYHTKSANEEALNQLNKLLNLYDEAEEPVDTMLVGQAYELMGLVYSVENRDTLALEYFDKAIEVYQKYPEAKKYALSNLLFNLADYYVEKRDFEKAKKLLERSLLYSSESPSDFKSLIESRIDLTIELIEKKKSNKLLSWLLGIILFISIGVLILLKTLLGKSRKEAALGKSLLELEKQNARDLEKLVESEKQNTQNLKQLVELERQKTKIKEDSEKLLHDVVKNDLIIIENNLSVDLQEVNNEQSFYQMTSRVKSQIISLLEKIGFPQGVVVGKVPVKTFVRKMYEKAGEILQKEIVNDSYLDEVEEFMISRKLSHELEACITEIFTNIKKHSQYENASLYFAYDINGLTIQIEDDGIGFDQNSLERKSGVKNIASRIAEINGHLTIKSSPGNGTKVTITLPNFLEETQP